jgi:release factor glutamine methyltransferase
MGKTYKKVVREYAVLLKNTTYIPQKEIEILLLNILNKNIIWLHINYNDICPKNIENKLNIFVQKRVTNYPLEYIIKKVNFYSKIFFVEDGVLIPRPQTEILVEKAEIILKFLDKPKVVEVGVGSGIISVMLALLIKDIQIIAVDINEKALKLAKKNAIKYNVEDKITFTRSDIFSEIVVKNFDMCISNPPYVANDYKLPKNVSYEPYSALFGGNIGDELLKNIVKSTYNNKIKYLLCEMGYNQKESLSRYLKDFKTKKIEFYKDLDKFDRGVSIEF